MIELIIERWRNLDGTEHFLWSVWQEGKRVEMSGRLASAATAETEGRAWCEKALARAPDRITQL
jgi:hypothetical protein